MQQVITWLGWFLLACGAIVLLLSPWMPPSAPELFKGAVPAGVLIALAGHLFSQARAAKESVEKRSHFYLDSCVKAYDDARSLLQDGNNDRATWIAAGRALMHAKHLAASVTVDAHLRVLELERLKYRGFFNEVLESKPAAFFYGVAGTYASLDDAGAASSVGEERGGRTLVSAARQLSDKALYAVWEAAQWPQHYKDPLDRGFSSEERAGLHLLFPGLHEFLEHKERWNSAGGKLFPRKQQ